MIEFITMAMIEKYEFLAPFLTEDQKSAMKNCPNFRQAEEKALVDPWMIITCEGEGCTVQTRFIPYDKTSGDLIIQGKCPIKPEPTS